VPVTSVRDLELYYELHGPPRAPCLLLVHGLGSSARDWEHQIEALAARYRVLAVDLRAHGRSSRRGPITMAGLAGDLAALLRMLELAQVHVVGISLGAGVAFQLAVDHPALVAGVIVINGGPEGPSTANPEHRAGIAWRIETVQQLGMHGLGAQLADRLFPDARFAPTREAFVERWVRNDAAFYLETFEAIIDWSVRHRLATLAVPCGVITGDRDYTPVAYKREYASELRDAEVVVIEQSGHMTTHDQPAALNAAILGFVDRWSA